MASSFHLKTNDANQPLTRYDEASVIFRATQFPSSTTEVVYFAMQLTFRQVDDSTRGGAHCGFQVGNGFADPENTGVNWGGYDDIAGGEYRGSISALPAGVSVNSPSFVWAEGVDYLLRVFKSPKQNWVTAELNTGPDQGAGEIAWRVEITNLTTQVTTIVRDIIVPNCKTTGALSDLMVWAEDFNIATAPTATVSWEIRWSELRENGLLVPALQVNYNTGTGVNTNTNSDTDYRGWRQKSVTSRTTADDDMLTHPGPVVRHVTQHSLGNQSASANLVLTAPTGLAVGDRLYAVLVTQWSDSVTVPTGWKQVGTPVVGASAGPKVTILTAAVATTPIVEANQVALAGSYTFVQSASTTTYAGALLALFGADTIASGVMGAGTASGVDTGATWNAPAIATSATNYGRVFVVTSVRPAGAGATAAMSTTVSRLKVTDTFTLTGNWITVAVFEEVQPYPSAAVVAKAGTAGVGHNIGVQFVAYPALQRLIAVSDTSVGSGVTTVPGSGTPGIVWPVIDDVAPDPADKAILPTGAAGTVKVKLTSGAIPNPNTTDGHRVRILYRRQQASTGQVVVDLVEGSTVRATKTITVPGGDAWLWDYIDLTPAEVTSITDRTNLYLTFTPTLT